MYRTPYRGCECQALSGAPAPSLSWYEKGKSIHTHLGVLGSLHDFQGGRNLYGIAEIESLPLNPERQGQDLAQLFESKNYKELGRYASLIFE